MHNELTFAAPSAYLQTEDVNAALEFSYKLNLHKEQFSLRDIRLNQDVLDPNNPDKGMTIDGEHLITSYGLVNLCKILRIPPPFAGVIPIDLLYHNIERLIKEDIDLPSVVLLRRDDGSVANVVKGSYDESPYSEVISTFLSKDPVHISISERLMKIALQREELSIKGNGDLDTLNIGTYVYSSLTKECKLHMTSGLYRTMCTNSFIMPYLGKVTAAYNTGAEDRLLKFTADIDTLLSMDAFDNLKEKFSQLVTMNLKKPDFLRIYSNLSRIIGGAEANALLGVDSEILKVIKADVRYFTHSISKAKLLGLDIPVTEESEFGVYDVMNKVTKHAQQYWGFERYALEKLGGHIIQEAILN
jgi:hypothetical protein